MGRTASNGLAMLDYLERHPIVTTAMVRDALGVSRTTASGLVDELLGLGLLKDTDVTRQRYKTFAYEPYLAILRSGGGSHH